MTADPLLPISPLSFADVVSGKHATGTPASPRTEAKSFSSILDNGGKIPIKQSGIFKGEPAICFSKEDISILAAPFRFSLIGKFSYRRPAMEVIRKFFASLGLKSLRIVGLLQDNHIIIVVTQQEDYMRLLSRNTWFITGFPMKVMKWSPDFFPSFESPIVPVWIAFPGLPIHLFEKSALFSLASVFGSPLKMDEPTTLLTRPTVARVCVDMDVSKIKLNRLWIGDEKQGFWQEVVYENPQVYCDFCKKLGHEEVHCFVKNPALKASKEKIRKEDEVEGENGTGAAGNALVLKDLGDNVNSIHVPVRGLDSHDNLPKDGATDEDEGVKEEGWVIKKPKKWQQKKQHQQFHPQPQQQKIFPNSMSLPLAQSTSGEVAMLSSKKIFSLAKVNDFSQGLSLTPVNPNFGVSSKFSSSCENGGMVSVIPAQQIQHVAEKLREKHHSNSASTAQGNSHYQSTEKKDQSSSDMQKDQIEISSTLPSTALSSQQVVVSVCEKGMGFGEESTNETNSSLSCANGDHVVGKIQNQPNVSLSPCDAVLESGEKGLNVYTLEVTNLKTCEKEIACGDHIEFGKKRIAEKLQGQGEKLGQASQCLFSRLHQSALSCEDISYDDNWEVGNIFGPFFFKEGIFTNLIPDSFHGNYHQIIMEYGPAAEDGFLGEDRAPIFEVAADVNVDIDTIRSCLFQATIVLQHSTPMAHDEDTLDEEDDWVEESGKLVEVFRGSDPEFNLKRKRKKSRKALRIRRST